MYRRAGKSGLSMSFNRLMKTLLIWAAKGATIRWMSTSLIVEPLVYNAVCFTRRVSEHDGTALNPMNSKHRLVRAIALFGAAFVFAADVINAHAGRLTFDSPSNLFVAGRRSLSKITGR